MAIALVLVWCAPSPAAGATTTKATTTGATATGATATGATATGATAAGADEVLLTFDDYPANPPGSPAAPPIIDRYAKQGVVFPDGVTALRFTQQTMSAPSDALTDLRSSPQSTSAAPYLPRSPQVVVTTCYAQEFCTNDVRMQFTRDMSRIVVHVGSRRVLHDTGTVVLVATDARGRPITEARVDLPSQQLVPAVHELAVEDPGGRIRGAEVMWAQAGLGHDGLILDDLDMTPFVPRPELSADPGRLSLSLNKLGRAGVVTLTNTGNMTFIGLAATLQPGASDAQNSAHLELGQSTCPDALAPDTSCTITLSADPVVPGTSTGVVIVQGRTANQETPRAILRVPVMVTVAAGVAPTESPRPVAPTESTSPVAATGTSFSIPTWPWWPWAVIALLLGSAGLVSLRMARRRVPSHSPRPHPGGPAPRVRVRPGTRGTALGGPARDPAGPVLTLTAVRPPPVTRVTEDHP